MRIALAIALALAATVTAASAQSMCGPYKQIVASLAAKPYNERQIAKGTTKIGGEGAGITLEVYGAPKGKTFTIVLVRPDGFACIIAAGESLQTFPLPVEGTDI